ncbi:MAG: phage late control D family protein [Butyrivibrio sp.]|nr:phage late control D family protein [Butyrivibrio sp.]
MAGIDLEELDKRYEGYYTPIVKVFIDDKDIEEDKKAGIKIKDVSINVTSELKAGIAEYSIVSVTDKAGAFDTKGLKKYICMGTCITVYMGHACKMTEVFRGFITGVNFLYSTEDEGEYAIRVTALDVKGIMMANRSTKRLKANYYSDAVKEILEQPTYKSIKDNNGITDITIYDTPDKQGHSPNERDVDNRIETVSESDYEFVVKAAKRFNFEFFVIGGNVVFRRAKSGAQEMGEIVPHSSVLSFDAGYDITDVVGNVIVRTLDIGKADKVEVKKKNSNKFSIGSKARPIINSQTYVYIDSSIESRNEAESRAEYILEDTSYRLGSLKMTLKGIPEFMPGRFLSLKGFGEAVSNKFYITDVTHEYDGFEYTTTIYGKASTL